MATDAAQVEAAARLLRLLRGDELVQAIILNGEREERAAGRRTAAELACMERLTREQVNRALREAVTADHSPAEIQRAIDFYTSPVGARYMHMVFANSHRDDPAAFPLTVEPAGESLTVDQWKLVADFSTSDLGAKFADPRLIAQSGAALDAVALLILSRRVECGTSR